MSVLDIRPTTVQASRALVQLEPTVVLATAATPVEIVLKSLNSSESGLSGIAADEILARVGPNQIEGAGRKHIWRALLLRFGNPLVLVLLGAASISALTGDCRQLFDNNDANICTKDAPVAALGKLVRQPAVRK